MSIKDWLLVIGSWVLFVGGWLLIVGRGWLIESASRLKVLVNPWLVAGWVDAVERWLRVVARLVGG
jgi:hypothetical protein